MADSLRRPGRLLLGNLTSVLVASVDITPADLEAVRLAGYSDQLPSPHGVDQPLEANVLGLSGGALEEPVYLVSTDSLYGGSLGAEVASLLGCSRDNVLVLASHTHFAPLPTQGCPGSGGRTPSTCAPQPRGSPRPLPGRHGMRASASERGPPRCRISS